RTASSGVARSSWLFCARARSRCHRFDARMRSDVLGNRAEALGPNLRFVLLEIGEQRVMSVCIDAHLFALHTVESEHQPAAALDRALDPSNQRARAEIAHHTRHIE